MAIEIEKKYRLGEEDFIRIPAALAKQNAVYTGQDDEENIIFGGGILAEKNAVLRLRRTAEKTVFTFKQRLESDSEIKRQLEHETAVADFDAAFSIALNLGFTPVVVYEKRRRTWKLNEAEIVLDELPFGLFMEIEGAAENIEAAEELLSLKDMEAVEETYPALTAKLGRNINNVMEARFDK